MEHYNYNGKEIIGIDHGFGNIKCRHVVFRSGVKEYDSEPAMTSDALFYIEDLCACGVRAVAAHIESSRYPSRFLNQIRQAGMRPGLALNYKTPVDAVIPYLDLTDYILLLTSESDCAGVGFKPYSIERVHALRTLLPDKTEIWVDGGVDDGNLAALARAGADRAVVGRALFAAPDPAQKARELCALVRAAKEDAE